MILLRGWRQCSRRMAAFLVGVSAGLVSTCPYAWAEEQREPPRVFGIQVAPGLKFVAHDPVSGVGFAAGGSPQTVEIGLGVTLIVLPRGWPVSLTVGGTYASSPSKHYSSMFKGPFDESASTLELGVGVRKTFGRENARGFFGGGLALCGAQVHDEFANGSQGEGSGGSGGFAEAGAFARVGRLVDLGAFVR
jgi:hypothetical protein